jgi:hypothetical protein
VPDSEMSKLALLPPSAMCSTRGMTGVKSRPGFAVPDSVHQVKLASPWRLPLRRTKTSAVLSAAGTSTVSAANSTRMGPALAVRADVSLVEERAAAAARGLGDGVGAAAATREVTIDEGGAVDGAGFVRGAGAIRALEAGGGEGAVGGIEAGGEGAVGGIEAGGEGV